MTNFYHQIRFIIAQSFQKCLLYDALMLFREILAKGLILNSLIIWKVVSLKKAYSCDHLRNTKKDLYLYKAKKIKNRFVLICFWSSCGRRSNTKESPLCWWRFRPTFQAKTVFSAVHFHKRKDIPFQRMVFAFHKKGCTESKFALAEWNSA